MVLNIRPLRLRTKRAELLNVFLCIIRFKSSSVQSTFYFPVAAAIFLLFSWSRYCSWPKMQKARVFSKVKNYGSSRNGRRFSIITSHYHSSIQWQWADCKQWAINISHAEIIAHPSGIKLNLWPAINNFRENVRGWFVELGNATEVVIC